MGAGVVGTLISRADAIEVTNRLDAEYFDAVKIQLEADLADRGGQPLSAWAQIVESRVNPKRADGPDFAYVEIGSVDRRDGFVLAHRVPREEAPSRARLLVHTGDVLLSSVRPLRSQVTYGFADLHGTVASTGFVPLRATGGLASEALFVMLKSRVAIEQLDRRARASMYPTLNPPEVLDITAPEVAPRVLEEVVNLVREAAVSRTAYLRSAAEVKRLSDAFFNGLVPEETWAGLLYAESVVRARSNVLADGAGARLDPEFHAPIFDRVFESMSVGGTVETVGQTCDRVTTGRSPKAADFAEEDTGGAAILKLAALSGAGVNWEAAFFAPKSWTITPAAHLAEGDVVFNSTAHEPNYVAHRVDAIGSVPIAYKDRLTFIADLLRLRLSDLERTPAHYVAAFIRSPLGREQIKRCIRGVRAHVYAEDVAREVRIPIPPTDVAEAISKAAGAAEAHRWAYSDQLRAAIALYDEAVDSTLAAPARNAPATVTSACTADDVKPDAPDVG